MQVRSRAFDQLRHNVCPSYYVSQQDFARLVVSILPECWLASEHTPPSRTHVIETWWASVVQECATARIALPR